MLTVTAWGILSNQTVGTVLFALHENIMLSLKFLQIFLYLCYGFKNNQTQKMSTENDHTVKS